MRALEVAVGEGRAREVDGHEVRVAELAVSENSPAAENVGEVSVRQVEIFDRNAGGDEQGEGVIAGGSFGAGRGSPLVKRGDELLFDGSWRFANGFS